MTPRKTQIVIALKLLAAAIFLTASAIPISSTCMAHATYHEAEATIMPIISTDNQTILETEEEIEERIKQAEQAAYPNLSPRYPYDLISPGVKEAMATMEPTESIMVTVFLGTKLDTPAKICEATGTLDRAIEEIWREIRRLEESGGDTASISTLQQEMFQLAGERGGKKQAVLVEQYGEIQTRAKQQIEALPDTSIIDSTLERNLLWVQTKVGNIEAIAEVPEVISISIEGESSRVIIATPVGITPLTPDNGFIGYTVNQPSFSWEPLGENTKYKFLLAKDGNLTQIIKEAEVSGTSYQYDGTLEYNTPYFWRVQCIEPACDSSPTFSFQTEAAPSPPSEASPQSQPGSPVLIVGLLIAIGAAVGSCIIWFLVARKTKAK